MRDEGVFVVVFFIKSEPSNIIIKSNNNVCECGLYLLLFENQKKKVKTNNFNFYDISGIF